MAEFCLDCFNKSWNKELQENDVTLSQYPELCEGCGEVKPVVVDPNPAPFWCGWLQKKKGE